jgi:uncharacterized protein YdbL (DUF1318 family)
MRKFLGLILFIVACACASQGFAATYDIKVMTPSVTAAIDGRKARFADLRSFKAQGLAGETRRGYVEAFGGGVVVRDIVNAENADRKAIYQAIVEQNGLDPEDGMAVVEAVFAGVQYDKALAGEKVQDKDGRWTLK